MILGIGTDIVSIKRIENIINKSNAFLKRVYSPKEIEIYHSRNNSISFLASRFAAKEAIVKTLKEYNKDLNNIEILNKDSGEPYVIIDGIIRYDIFISISYEKDYVLAYAILSSI